MLELRIDYETAMNIGAAPGDRAMKLEFHSSGSWHIHGRYELLQA